MWHRTFYGKCSVRVLIADDDRELALAISSYLRHCNEEVVATVTTGGLDVVRNTHRFQPDVIIMDIMMPRLNGLTVCHHILSRFPNTKIILFSGKLDADHPLVVNSGAAAFLKKPVKLAELSELIGKILTCPPPKPVTNEQSVVASPDEPPSTIIRAAF